MPGMDGLEFIRELDRRRLGVQVLMITAHASVASAVEAMRHGAFDYLEKPFDATRVGTLGRPGLRSPPARVTQQATSATASVKPAADRK